MSNIPHYFSKINLRDLFIQELSNFHNIYQESVIYYIHNDINNKGYIGQASDLIDRFRTGRFTHLNDYRLHNINGSNIILYKALSKYRSRNFTVYVIDEANTQDELNIKESNWIQELHTYIHDPLGPGYNMTLGGEDCSQLNTFEAQQKALKTKRLNGEGDCMYMCHTKEASIKRSETNLLKYGNELGRLNTPDTILNIALSQLFNSINNYLDKLKLDNAPVPITWDIYWNWSDGYMAGSHMRRHVRKVLDKLTELRLDSRWTAEMESIFSTALQLKYKYNF